MSEYQYKILIDKRSHYFGDYKVSILKRIGHPSESILQEEISLFEPKFYSLDNFINGIKNKITTREVGSVILFSNKDPFGKIYFDALMVRNANKISKGKVSNIETLKKIFEKENLDFKFFLF